MMRILVRNRGWKGQNEIVRDLPNRDQFFVLYINLQMNFKRISMYKDDAFEHKLAYMADFLVILLPSLYINYEEFENI